MSEEVRMVAGWKPGDDIVIVFADKTGEDRTEQDFAIMFADINRAANNHDFSRKQSGTNETLAKWYHHVYAPDGSIRE
jgi:hypothetical protein